MPKARKPGSTKNDLREVSDSPELTKADFAKPRPFAEIFPDLGASSRKEVQIKGTSRKVVSRKTS